MATPIRARSRTQRRQGNISSSTQVTSPEGREQKPIDIEKPVDAFTNHPSPAYVEVSGSITKNMGNFNSVRVGVVVTLPCDPTQDAVDKAKKKCADLVDTYLDEEYKKAVGDDE